MKRTLEVIIALAVVAALIGVDHLINTISAADARNQAQAHALAVAKTDTAIAALLGNQHVTSYGTPQTVGSQIRVPLAVSASCTVVFDVMNPTLDYVAGRTPVVLDIPFSDGTGKFLVAADQISNASTQAQVEASLTGQLARTPTNQVCAR
jgi:hypothetical protein